MLFNSKSTALAASALMALLASTESASAVPTANLHNSRGESVAKLHHRQTTSSSSTVTPTAPGPGDKFKAGGECTTEWTAGSDPAWSSFDIDLMTGSNTQMTKLASVATGLDGSSTTTTSLTYKCPEVSPYSAIYFYQYTPKGTSDGEPTWTTRFTITDANGKSVAEPQKTQPDGKAIPWGTGKLVSSVSGSSNSTSSSSTGSAAAGTSSSSASQQQSSSTQASTTPATQASSSTASTASTSSTQQNSSSNAATTKSNSNTSTSGAMTVKVASASSLVGGVVAVFAASLLL